MFLLRYKTVRCHYILAHLQHSKISIYRIALVTLHWLCVHMIAQFACATQIFAQCRIFLE